jgi:hypothetical protein
MGGDVDALRTAAASIIPLRVGGMISTRPPLLLYAVGIAGTTARIPERGSSSPHPDAIARGSARTSVGDGWRGRSRSSSARRCAGEAPPASTSLVFFVNGPGSATSPRRSFWSSKRDNDELGVTVDGSNDVSLPSFRTPPKEHDSSSGRLRTLVSSWM